MTAPQIVNPGAVLCHVPGESAICKDWIAAIQFLSHKSQKDIEIAS